MQNLEVLAWKMTELLPIALPCPNLSHLSVSESVSQSVTNLGIELFSQLKNLAKPWYQATHIKIDLSSAYLHVINVPVPVIVVFQTVIFIDSQV